MDKQFYCTKPTVHLLNYIVQRDCKNIKLIIVHITIINQNELCPIGGHSYQIVLVSSV